MHAKKIQNLIKVWYEKARNGNDHFTKFVFLWICFNAWLDYSSGKDTDAEMIKWLVSQTAQTSDIVRAFESSKHDILVVDSIDTLVNLSPFNDARGKRPQVVITNKNDFENIVWAIYRIRCNLFHGGSASNEDRVLNEVAMSKNILNIWIQNIILSW